MNDTLDTVFPGCADRLGALRKTDVEFDEICTHFEIILTEINQRFGAVDGATTDLIISFEDLRQEIVRMLRASSVQGKSAERHADDGAKSQRRDQTNPAASSRTE